MAAKRFFDATNGLGLQVLELGGWDGELASLILPEHQNIHWWSNYEIAPVDTVCHNRQYHHREQSILDDSPDGYDVFIASHSLEHLSDEHAKRVLDIAVECDWIYLDIPTPTRPWGLASHKMNMGWAEIASYVRHKGFREFDSVELKESTVRMLTRDP